MEKGLNLKYIKERRNELEISQEDVALQLGLKTAANYSKYENGHYKFNANVLPELAKVLKCSILNFFAK